MPADISFKKVTPNDAGQLLELSRQTFFDAFAHLNNAADMEAYAAKAFRLEKLSDEINNEHSDFYFAEYNDEVTGYLKLNCGDAQTEFQEPGALEVERIYVSARYQGMKIGGRMLAFAVQTAVNRSCGYIWLGVWENNHKAIKFYEQHGFKKFGSHNFMLGNDLQTDVLMKKYLINATVQTGSL